KAVPKKNRKPKQLPRNRPTKVQKPKKQNRKRNRRKKIVNQLHRNKPKVQQTTPKLKTSRKAKTVPQPLNRKVPPHPVKANRIQAKPLPPKTIPFVQPRKPVNRDRSFKPMNCFSRTSSKTLKKLIVG